MASTIIMIAFVLLVAAATQLTLSLYTIPYAIPIALALCGLRLRMPLIAVHVITAIAVLGALSAVILTLMYLPLYIGMLIYTMGS